MIDLSERYLFPASGSGLIGSFDHFLRVSPRPEICLGRLILYDI
jgi:hypothetical protein